MENIFKDADFIDDEEKMYDFVRLTKEEFLSSYSYLTEDEYDNTKRLYDMRQNGNYTLTKQDIEDKLYDFFNDKMTTGDAPEIEDVKRFKNYLCTMDNGIVIDCTNGTQICLTIQTR